MVAFHVIPGARLTKEMNFQAIQEVYWEERNTCITICVRAWTIFLLNDEPNVLDTNLTRFFFNFDFDLFYFLAPFCDAPSVVY